MEKPSLFSFPRTFHLLSASQFLGALNDNLFRFLVVFQLIALQGAENAVQVSALCALLYVSAFLIGSPFGGILADRFPKRTVLHFFNLVEIAVMLLGLVGFALQSSGVLAVALFFMALQSSLFGPSKSGLLPEIIRRENLNRANGVQVGLIYLAIVLGTAGASAVSYIAGGHFFIAGLFCVAISIAGAVCSGLMPPSAVCAPASPVVMQYRNCLADIRKTPRLAAALVASAAFLFIGAFIQIQIIGFGIEHIGLSKEQGTLLFLSAAVGIGLGAALHLLKGSNHTRLWHLGLSTAAMAAATALLSLLATTVLTAALLLAAIGFFGGTFIVTIRALIHINAPAPRRGSVLALSTILDFSGVLLASACSWLLSAADITAAESFLLLAGFMALLSVVIFHATLLHTMRILLRVLFSCVYTLRTSGTHHIPTTSGALFICNHVSWIDALLVFASSPRPVRFMMARQLYNLWFLRPFMKRAGVIPVALTDGPRQMLTSLQQAQAAINKGDIVCIFPEGKIVRDGFSAPYKRGVSRIAQNIDAPIIPIHIDGAWGSSFSYYGGKLFSAGLRPRSRRTIRIRFGQALNSGQSTAQLQQAVNLQAVANAKAEHGLQCSLPRSLFTSARKRLFARSLSDSTGKKLSNVQVLSATILLDREIRAHCPTEQHIGVLLPASVGGALVNTAIALSGKISVNLNFTASPCAITSAARQCSLRTIYTSRAFMEKVAIPPFSGCTYRFLEDILPQISTLQRIGALLCALFMPLPYIVRRSTCGNSAATILFSSGSTAEPKGVVLSHRNILANCSSVQKALAVNSRDGICSALPLFHSFGYTATVWFPLISGFRATYHPNPMEAAAIAKSIQRDASTILLATPTFLAGYYRKARPEQLRSLRLVVVGAEKLKEKLARAFAEKFGIVALEGYGATELSPVASFNIPDTSVKGQLTRGNKPGTIGRILPGMCARVVDPDTHEALGCSQSGLLLVKGANVMQGYLGKPQQSRKAVIDGWYVTGDIAAIDSDGFITLTDRLSRFSKIGGEMISHGTIDEVFASALATEQLCAVTSAASDEQRGEKLVVVYDENLVSKKTLQKILQNSSLPNLYKPREFVAVNQIPFLGSGKLDLQEIKKYAAGQQPLLQAA